MKQSLAAFACGILFGLGLTVAQMINPAKVLAFLDLFGDWDPSLALVMGGALAVAALGFRLVFQRGKPLFAEGFQLPTKTDLDGRLIGGSALFGIGWGLAGFCPGPALAALATGAQPVFVFFLSMAAGMALYRLLVQPRIRSAAA